MFKPLLPSVFFLYLATATTSVIASTDVDFATTHLFQEQQVDKQYVLDALVQNSSARWNYDSPVGTPITIYYAFTGATSKFWA